MELVKKGLDHEKYRIYEMFTLVFSFLSVFTVSMSFVAAHWKRPQHMRWCSTAQQCISRKKVGFKPPSYC